MFFQQKGIVIGAIKSVMLRRILLVLVLSLSLSIPGGPPPARGVRLCQVHPAAARRAGGDDGAGGREGAAGVEEDGREGKGGEQVIFYTYIKIKVSRGKSSFLGVPNLAQCFFNCDLRCSRAREQRLEQEKREREDEERRAQVRKKRNLGIKIYIFIIISLQESMRGQLEERRKREEQRLQQLRRQEALLAPASAAGVGGRSQQEQVLLLSSLLI